jgi:vitamin B12 transporter
LPQLTGKRPAQSPAWSGSISFTAPLLENGSVRMSVRGESERFDDDLNTRTLPAYGALDLVGTYRLTSKVALTLALENALNSPIATARSGDGLVSFTQGSVFRVGLSMTAR